jgi:hypothetical protein
VATFHEHNIQLRPTTTHRHRIVLSAGSEQVSDPSLGGSSNGRTADSDSASLGSNPSPPANKIKELSTQWQISKSGV